MDKPDVFAGVGFESAGNAGLGLGNAGATDGCLISRGPVLSCFLTGFGRVFPLGVGNAGATDGCLISRGPVLSCFLTGFGRVFPLGVDGGTVISRAGIGAILLCTVAVSLGAILATWGVASGTGTASIVRC
jgi:hypothetical protein